MTDTTHETAMQIWNEFFGPTEESAFRHLSVEEYACCGCPETDGVLEVFSILAQPQAHHPQRWFVHRPACAARAGFVQASKMLELCEAAGVWPVILDTEGRPLPHWRDREIRTGVDATSEQMAAPPPASRLRDQDLDTPPLSDRRLQRLRELHAQLFSPELPPI